MKRLPLRAAASQRSLWLAPAAAAAWGIAALATSGTSALPGAAAAVGGGAAVVLGALTWRRTAAGSWAAASLAAVVLGVVAIVVGASAVVHVKAVTAPPWPQLTEQRAVIRAMVEVREPARVMSRPGAWDSGGDRQRTVVRVLEWQSGPSAGLAPTSAEGTTAVWHSRSLVDLVAPLGPDGAPLQAGQRATAELRLAPSTAGGRAGVAATASAQRPLVIVAAAGGAARSVADWLRAAMSGYPAADAELALGMVTGDDSRLPVDDRRTMQAAGLSHLTAVSGANIAMLLAVVTLGCRLVGVTRRWSALPMLVALAGFVALVGPSPSVVRAAAMATVGIVGVVMGGGTGMAALLASIVVLLGVDPWLAQSRGFALSCAATAGLILAAGPGRRAVSWVRERTGSSLLGLLMASSVTAVAAGAATAPLLAAYGQGVSWVSLVANVIVAPLVPVVVFGALAAIGLAALGDGVQALGPAPHMDAALLAPAHAAAWIPAHAAAGILWVARQAADLPGGRLPWPAGAGWGLLLAGLLSAAALLARRWRWLTIALPASIAICSVALARAPTALAGGLPADWQAVFCDVGQGDAALIRSGPSSAVLVDAGPDPTAARECLDRSGVDQLDAVVLSHFHRDHSAGLAAALDVGRPVDVLVSGLAAPADTYAEVSRVLAGHGARAVVPSPGARFAVGWTSWTVLGPSRTIREDSEPNNNSISLLVQVQRDLAATSYLLAGDLEPVGQGDLMAHSGEMAVDVVKVPHHGSARQHPRLPQWAHARAAVISCGEGNDYGHPAASTVAAWQASGAQVLRTDLQGDVIVVGGPSGSSPRLFTRKLPRLASQSRTR